MNGIELLFQHARDHKFKEFDSLFLTLEAELPLDELWEAYLLRAQIKLYITDLTLLADLEKAEQVGGTPRFLPLCTYWNSDIVDRFIIFPTAEGALKEFLAALPLVREKLSRWYDGQSDIVVRQVQCEICYFMGDIEATLALANEQYNAEPKSNSEKMYSMIMKYRGFLGLAEPEKALQCVFEIIQTAKAHPECGNIYAAFRGWANMITGWSGDTPRFYEDGTGQTQPVLEGRMTDGIKTGLSEVTIREMPFIEYGAHAYSGAYSFRQYYMEMLHAMYWLSIGDNKQAQFYFKKVYDIATASGVVMPIIECGGQIMPLLKYMRECDGNLHLDDIMTRAAHYEEGLQRYRLTDQ